MSNKFGIILMRLSIRLLVIIVVETGILPNSRQNLALKKKIAVNKINVIYTVILIF